MTKPMSSLPDGSGTTSQADGIVATHGGSVGLA
jgi:hypothetical protein